MELLKVQDMIEYKGFKIKSLHRGDFDAYNNVFMGTAVLEDGSGTECHFWDETSILFLAAADHPCRLCKHFSDCSNWVVRKPGSSQGRPWDGHRGGASEDIEPARANKDGIVKNCCFFIHKDYCNW
jgi:hypothetical protein